MYELIAAAVLEYWQPGRTGPLCGLEDTSVLESIWLSFRGCINEPNKGGNLLQPQSMIISNQLSDVFIFAILQ